MPQEAPPKAPARPHLDPPALEMTTAARLFDMGAAGEEKYRGKVVAIYGKVNVDAMQPAPAGGTTAAVVEGEGGGPPYAVATLGEESNELLFGTANQWRPVTSVGFHGIYRGRDRRGTVVLDSAQVMFVGRPGPIPPSGPKTEVAKKDRPKKDRGKADGGETHEPPVAVTAEKLAQDLADDIMKNYPRYYGKPLQVKGVVHKRAEDKGAVVRLEFRAPVKDPKTGKADEWAVFCGLKTPVRTGDEAAAALAVGKTVTVRGQLSAGGNGQATLLDCEVVRE